MWKCKNTDIDYKEKVLIMGIVNVTPDSFSDGGDNFSTEAAVSSALRMVQEGADIIDIGAQSTRPGHVPVSEEEEWCRLKGVLAELNGKSAVPLSVDTYYPSVAEKALKSGVSIINDVSGVISPEMAEIIKNSGAGWIIMHNGSGDVDEVKQFFTSAVNEAVSLGVSRNQLCLDMGIGFGKTRQQDASLIANIKQYKMDDLPLLLGTSRKRVIGEGSGQQNPKERIYGNIAADTAAILGGADIIRLHDVAREKQGIRMAEMIKRNLKQSGEENG